VNLKPTSPKPSRPAAAAPAFLANATGLQACCDFVIPNLLILSGCRRPEEREFYLRLAADRRWSTRELERQIDGCLFERAVLNPPKVSAVLTQLHPDAAAIFKDSYLQF